MGRNKNKTQNKGMSVRHKAACGPQILTVNFIHTALVPHHQSQAFAEHAKLLPMFRFYLRNIYIIVGQEYIYIYSIPNINKYFFVSNTKFMCSFYKNKANIWRSLSSVSDPVPVIYCRTKWSLSKKENNFII